MKKLAASILLTILACWMLVACLAGAASAPVGTVVTPLYPSDTSVTGVPGKIPKGSSTGKLDPSWITPTPMPTIVSAFTNDSGYASLSVLGGYSSQFAGAYNPATVYSISAIVSYNGGFYQRNITGPFNAGILPTNTTNWAVFNIPMPWGVDCPGQHFGDSTYVVTGYNSTNGQFVCGQDAGSAMPITSVFATLGGASIAGAGKQIYCTDCTTAATCVAGGSGHMAVSNGTTWTCQ